MVPKNVIPTANENIKILKGVGFIVSKLPKPATALKIAFIKTIYCLTKTHQTSCKQ